MIFRYQLNTTVKYKYPFHIVTSTSNSSVTVTWFACCFSKLSTVCFNCFESRFGISVGRRCWMFDKILRVSQFPMAGESNCVNMCTHISDTWIHSNNNNNLFLTIKQGYCNISWSGRSTYRSVSASLFGVRKLSEL